MANYYSSDCIWPSLITRGSFKAPWRSICRYIDLVVDRVTRRLGDGASTSFRHDSLLSYGVLTTTYPWLFRITQQPEAMVANVWVPSTSSWNLNLWRNLTELEVIEWASLSRYLAPIKLHPFSDSWLWPLDPSSNFIVKSLIANLVGDWMFMGWSFYFSEREFSWTS